MQSLRDVATAAPVVRVSQNVNHTILDVARLFERVNAQAQASVIPDENAADSLKPPINRLITDGLVAQASRTMQRRRH